MKTTLGIFGVLVLAGCAVDAQHDATMDPQSQEPADESTGGIDVVPIAANSVRAVAPDLKLGSEQAMAYPVSKVLDTSATKYFVEPEGITKGVTKRDDGGHAYADDNYWNFCGPGAEAVVLYYSPWRSNPKYGTINTYYKEPYGTHVSNTFWTSPSNDATYGYKTMWRPSIMYLAEYSKPPVFSSAGVDSFSSYPTKGSKTSDVCDSLNWEASDHASKSSYCGSGSYWYTEVSGSTTFHAHVQSDVNATFAGQTGWALWVAVNTYESSTNRLPNWSRNLVHAIAIVGYDDNAGTYTYVDTCGTHCNSSPGNQKSTREFTISQSALHAIMVDYIW